MASVKTTTQRLIVVSNRMPFTLKRADGQWQAEHSSGGLATAMEPLLAQSRGIWVGWSGDSSDLDNPQRKALLDHWAEREGCFAVELPPDVAYGFYEGYSNQTLWPLLHHFPSLLKFNPEYWKAYVEANQRYRDVILEHLKPDDLIWIHDYHLLLLPHMVREAAPHARIGFFLHTPFPSSAIFRLLPRREELLQGLLGADYLAFHTHAYLQNFRNSVLRILGFDSRMDRVQCGDRGVRLDALPIGIAPKGFSDLLDKDEETKRHLAHLRERFADRRILLAVDRLDYTKGIPERMRTFGRLLRQAPALRGRGVLIQIAVPSREDIPMYKELRHEVDELVGKINGEFSTPDWTPIIYIRRNIPRAELTALYAAAELAWVTPLCDGLNLVAKEYIACQEGQAGGLILSEFAGAAAEMGEAFLVNPYDEERTAESIEHALSLPDDQRRERIAALHKRVVRNDVFKWGARFLSNLSDAAASREAHPSAKPTPLPIADLIDSYRQAQRRHLLLDYDGTLVPFAKRPQDAAPVPELPPLLEKLASDKANTVVIISGRSRDDLEGWLGDVPGLWLAAEHGAIMRSPDTMAWEHSRENYTDRWKKRVLGVLEHFVDRTPGSLIEEKECALVWHYRMADPVFGAWLANELVATLEQLLAETELRAFSGERIVEVKPVWANKGELLTRLEHLPTPDFCLAAGDDRTDEDLFARLPDDAWTIHVGDKDSRARFCLPDPAAMRGLLDRFVEVDDREGA
ncbi:MAG: bifunctional alpha,alpha-trehalose-phosphate synthase (UDP-forming)/trehalose-phosphatase [Gammaproteobacteria bacterium]